VNGLIVKKKKFVMDVNPESTKEYTSVSMEVMENLNHMAEPNMY
jgi:hypothetical protein